MSNLTLIRYEDLANTTYVYSEEVNVVIVGDVVAFDYLIKQFTKARNAKAGIVLDVNKDTNVSMRGLLLPAQKTKIQSALIQIGERVIHLGGKPVMEMVVAANDKGYQELTELMEKAIELGEDSIGERAYGRERHSGACGTLTGMSNGFTIHPPFDKWDRKIMDKVDIPMIGMESLFDPNPYRLPRFAKKKKPEPYKPIDPDLLGHWNID